MIVPIILIPDLDVQTMVRFLSSRLTMPKIKLAYVAVLIVLFATAPNILGQTNIKRNNNNPYSPSPERMPKQDDLPAQPENPGTNEVVFVMQSRNSSSQDDRPTVAQQTFKIAKNADLRVVSPSEVYKIGVGDILFINLKNSTGGSGYYTVRSDGTIDYPLAGENVIVADQTVESIEEMLESSVTLFTNPQVEVKVREYASHKIAISGLAENTGDKYLQREAIPLYVIRAQVGVSPNAATALITRTPSLKVETYDLHDANTANVLVYPGNSIEFTRDVSGIGTYFVAGDVVSAGQKQFVPGLTLYQALISAGGLKGDARKVIIRRRNEKGLFSNFEYNLNEIKDGKVVDPTLSAGDIIEVRN